MMSRERDFILYRSHTDRNESKLSLIQEKTNILLDIQIEIPETIHKQTIKLYSDDEFCEDEEFERFRETRTLPLFNKLTLVSLFGGTNERIAENIVYGLRGIRSLSAGFRWIAQLRRGGGISFDGFRDDEVEDIIRAYQKKAETRLKRVRDIHTNTKYLLRQRAGIHPVLTSMDDAPPELRKAPKTTSGDRIRDDVPVFDEFWLTRAVGFSIAMNVLDHLEAIVYISKPRPPDPDTLDFVSSDKSNYLSIPRQST